MANRKGKKNDEPSNIFKGPSIIGITFLNGLNKHIITKSESHS